MKRVQIRLVLDSKDQYQQVIDGLLRLYIPHIATFEPNVRFEVRCFVSHVQADLNLDTMLGQLGLMDRKQISGGNTR